MKNTIGTSVALTIFGESHGPAVGAVIDGLAPGIRVDEEGIARALTRRRPDGVTSTARVEADRFQILSGVFDGRTTGTPLAIVIPNENVRSADYASISALARPSHADYAAFCKYHGHEDRRGGGHFSGRITAGIVAAGAVCMEALNARGITVGAHVRSCAGVDDRGFGEYAGAVGSLKERIAAEVRQLSACEGIPVLDAAAGRAMEEEILRASASCDSVGGVVQAAVCGLPAGVGEPWFDSLEGALSRAMFALGGVKGIEFGEGYALCSMRGSEANDPFRIAADGSVETLTNSNGGINGGISNGMPIVFDVAVKPTPSIAQVQRTVDFERMEDSDIAIRGRHDPAIVRRICPVVEAMTAIVLCDMLALRFGTDYLAG